MRSYRLVPEHILIEKEEIKQPRSGYRDDMSTQRNFLVGLTTMLLRYVLSQTDNTRRLIQKSASEHKTRQRTRPKHAEPKLCIYTIHMMI